MLKRLIFIAVIINTMLLTACSNSDNKTKEYPDSSELSVNDNSSKEDITNRSSDVSTEPESYYTWLKKKESDGYVVDDASGYVYIDSTDYVGPYGRTYEANGIVLAYWFGTDTVITIPEYINGLKVVGCEDKALLTPTPNGERDYAFEIEELIFPEDFSEVTIRFPDAKRLKKVSLPKNQQELRSDMFVRCISLESFDCPESLTIINESAFHKCKSLKTITFNNSLTEIGKHAFWECSILSEIDLPDSLQKIGNGAFGKCNTLTSVEIPDSVTVIEKRAFRWCEALQKVNLSKNITKIDMLTFDGCVSLEEIHIPESVVEIDELAFTGCDKLTIYGKSGSCAEKFANQNDIPFRAE